MIICFWRKIIIGSVLVICVSGKNMNGSVMIICVWGNGYDCSNSKNNNRIWIGLFGQGKVGL